MKQFEQKFQKTFKNSYTYASIHLRKRMFCFELYYVYFRSIQFINALVY